MAGGSVGAAVGLVERSHRQAIRLLGVAPRVLVSGVGAPKLLDLLEIEPAPESAPGLVLEGLAVHAAHREDKDE